jgi:hypothetical protein
MQLVAERQSVDTIRAQMNYIVDTGVPPVRYIDWPEMAHKEIPPQYKQHEMTIRNGRPLRDTFRLDTHGFVFADHHTAMKDFTDETERKRVYDREVAELIKKHSGASEVLVFDHTIRIGDEQAMKAINARPPVKGVHNDYTESSAPRRLREIAGDAEAERRFKKRWAIIQVWRPIRGTVMIDPLGMCDGRSIPQTGFHPGAAALQGPHRRGLPHRLQSGARVVLLPADETRRRRWCSRCSTPTSAWPRGFSAHSAFDDPIRRRNAPAARKHRDPDIRVLGLCLERRRVVRERDNVGVARSGDGGAHRRYRRRAAAVAVRFQCLDQIVDALPRQPRHLLCPDEASAGGMEPQRRVAAISAPCLASAGRPARRCAWPAAWRSAATGCSDRHPSDP